MIHLYYHGGSGNHGCEAIVRSTVKLVNKKMNLWTTAPNEDILYKLDDIINIIDDNAVPFLNNKLKYFHSAISHKLTGNDYVYTKYAHSNFLNSISSNDICMSIGGDNYCYTGLDKLGYYNKMIHGKGAKTVLWGCSVEPSALSYDVINDLKLYDLITVRESLSYKGLVDAGIKDNVVLCADPAFQLDCAKVDLPNNFSKSNTIGINISPLVINSGNLVFDNYIELINHIIYNTKDNVLLVPHVVKSDSDDRIPLNKIYEQFKDTNRIAIIDDTDCMRIKGYISQCKQFIGARTHATIAAYSTFVPTLVVGYSIKAKGIAVDLFGTDDGYVVSAQQFNSKDDLLNAYIWLNNNSEIIESKLHEIIPTYKENSYKAVEALTKLGG